MKNLSPLAGLDFVFAYEGLTPLASCSHPCGVKIHYNVTIICGTE